MKDTNEERVRLGINRLRELAKAAIEPYRSSPMEAPLETMSRLTPDSIELIKALHEEIAGLVAKWVRTCGLVDEDIVPILNGLKDHLEQIDGHWVYEDSRWRAYPFAVEAINAS